MSSFRRRSSRRYVARPKRNSERIVRGGQSWVATGTQQTAYTYTADQACTVKSIKLDLGVAGAGLTEHDPAVPYALVVVREGYSANALTWPAITEDMYNPTMDVLISGVITDSGVEDHKSNWIGRKLKKGDRLCLVIALVGGQPGDQSRVTFEMNFSVLT